MSERMSWHTTPVCKCTRGCLFADMAHTVKYKKVELSLLEKCVDTKDFFKS